MFRAHKAAALVALFAMTLGLNLSIGPSAEAATNITATGTNPRICDQTVADTTGVTAYRLAGGDCVVEFKNSGTTSWTSPALISSVQILVVAGGGGGGSRHAGAGGGGGLLYVTNYGATANTTYSLTVGAGGAGAAGVTVSGGGRAGLPSNFGGSSGAGSLVAHGGAGGAGGGNAAGDLNNDGSNTSRLTRGNGGGTNASTGALGSINPGSINGTLVNAGTTTPSINGVTATANAYGNLGAVGRGDGNCKSASGTYTGWCGGGGGGASAAGASPTQPGGGTNVWIAGKGGDGQSISITGSSVTYAGGGGGAAGSDATFTTNALCKSGSPSVGPGGAGGGGAGGQCVDAATSGTANTGGGGGGGGLGYISGDPNNQQGPGGAGGSGIVIIRYTPDSVAPTISSGATVSVAENIATSTNATTIILSESSTITLTSTTDGSLFSIIVVDTVTARIRFQASPDFEGPTDVGANNVYNIVITAVDIAGNSANLSVTITVTNVNESSALSAPSINATIYKGVKETITVTVNVAGKVRFLVGGKRIANCLSRSTSGSYPNYTATCLWSPTVSGRQVLTATVTPSDNTFSSGTSTATTVFIQKRSTRR